MSYVYWSLYLLPMIYILASACVGRGRKELKDMKEDDRNGIIVLLVCISLIPVLNIILLMVSFIMDRSKVDDN